VNRLGGETQPERTALSWQRTALGVLAVSGLMAHRAVVGGHPRLLAVAGGCAALGIVLMSAVGLVRDRRVREQVAADQPIASPGLAAAGTTVVVVVAVAAVVGILVARLT
jgi:putative membrane protein